MSVRRVPFRTWLRMAHSILDVVTIPEGVTLAMPRPFGRHLVVEACGFPRNLAVSRPSPSSFFLGNGSLAFETPHCFFRLVAGVTLWGG